MEQDEQVIQNDVILNDAIKEPQFPSLINTVIIGIIWFVVFSLILKIMLPKIFRHFRSHSHFLNFVTHTMFIGFNFFIPFVIAVFDPTSLFVTTLLAIAVFAGITFPIAIGLLEVSDVVYKRLN